MLGGIPHNIKVDICIVVNKPMPKSCPSFEVDLWICCTGLVRNVVGGFAKNLEIVDYEFRTVVAFAHH